MADNPSATNPKDAYINSALQQRRKGSTYYGYDPKTGDQIAFSDPKYFNQYFQSFDEKAPAPEFDTTAADKAANTIIKGTTQQQQPTTPAAPAVKPKTEREALQPFIDAYLNTIGPSEGVKSAKQAYLDMVAQRDKTVAAREGQGRGIVLPLIRGQQERDYKLAAPEIQRLQGDVSIAESEAATEANKAKARLDYESALFGNEKAAAEKVDAGTKVTPLQAQEFALTNNITTPVYKSGGKFFDTATRSEVDLATFQRLTGQKVGAPESETDFTKNVTELKAASNAKAPNLEGSASTGYFYWDPEKGKFVQAIAPAPKSTPQPTNTEKVTEAENKVDAYFTSGQLGPDGYEIVGTDGYASPEAYNAARAAWIEDGFSASSFDSKFRKYINPEHRQDYKGGGGAK